MQIPALIYRTEDSRSPVAIELNLNESRDLENARQKAQESDKLKSAFLTNLSHEIRTPMNGIVGFSQLMNEPNCPEDKRTQYAKIINESGPLPILFVILIFFEFKIQYKMMLPNENNATIILTFFSIPVPDLIINNVTKRTIQII